MRGWYLGCYIPCPCGHGSCDLITPYILSLYISAKATYAAITNTYSYLTPDLWRETVFIKSPYQEYTDYLMKHHVRSAGLQRGVGDPPPEPPKPFGA